jgi:hypothetical protein
MALGEDGESVPDLGRAEAQADEAAAQQLVRRAVGTSDAD